jgi:hypothetical protein
VILGMHRSGTSALARCASLLGGDLGPTLLEPRPDNEAGFWEDAAVVAQDDAALLGLNLVWSDAWPIDPARWQDPVVASARSALLDVVRERTASGALWVVKDPRISRLVPLWTSLLDEAGVEARFVLALRHPAEIAASLARRDGLSAAHCHLLWLRYVLESELHTRGRRRTFVRFGDLLSDWRRTMARAAGDLELEWPIAGDEAAPHVDEFLRASLRHHVADAAAFAGDPAVPPWVRRAAEALEQAADGLVESAMRALDEVRDEIEAADGVVTRVARELEGRVFGLRAAADRPGHPIREAHERALRLEVELSQARRESEQARRETAQAQAAYAELVERLAASSERTGRLDAELALARETIGTQARREVELRETLEAILGSRSWRLTSVLRSLARRSRGATTPRAARA